MNDRLTGHRQTRFTVTLLDHKERPKGLLKRVRGGDVTLSATTRLKASGSINLMDIPSTLNWLKDRVKIEISANEVSWSLGVFLIAAPKTEYTEEGKRYRVELISKLAVLDQNTIEETLSLPEGTLVLETVETLIRQEGESRLIFPPSNARLAAATSWQAGTTILTIINDLLKSIGYWSLNVDGNGNYISSPYIRPSQRPRTWEFTEGKNAIHIADWSRDRNTATVPNRILLVTNTNPPMVAKAENTNPSSPYSYAVRGRWITRVEKDVQASDQLVLNALAQRKLDEASAPQSSLDVEFAPIVLSPNDIVRWRSQGFDCLASVQSLSFTLEPTALCEAKLKEVVEL